MGRVHLAGFSRGWAAWAVSLLLAAGTGAFGFIPDDDAGIIHHWALLIAGSRGWGNYRHQADVAHAYQVLVKGGMPTDRIVVMMEDDIAFNPYNPVPGKVYNCPGCDDVYHGLEVDYKHSHVNATNFLSVLAGDSEAMQGIGTGRVIASGPHDRVFVYYTDHGAPGLVAMPHGRSLFADELADALRAKHAAGGFYELVLFMEACHSGSMFRGLLSGRVPVFATTASNATESSWATYCPTHVVPRNETAKHPTDHIDTCLGDLYSVGWIELAERYNLHHWSLQKEFERVRNRTSNHHTFEYGSHAKEFGRMEISKEHASNFEGFHKRVAPPQLPNTLRSSSDYVTIEQHDADLVHLRLAAAAAPSRSTGEPLKLDNAVLDALDGAQGDVMHPIRGDESSNGRHMLASVDGEALGADGAALAAEVELQAAAAERARVDVVMVDALQLMLWDGGIGDLLGLEVEAGGLEWGDSGAVLARMERVAKDKDAAREAAQQPIVDSWACLKEFVAAYEDVCGRLTMYAARHTLWMATLCNSGASPGDWQAALQLACARE